MLRSSKFRIGEGSLEEPNPKIRSRRPQTPQVMEQEEGQELMFEDETTFRKASFNMNEMVKVLYIERTTRLQGESYNQPKGEGGNESKPPHPHPPSPPPSSPSSPSSLHRPTPLTSPSGHSKSPLFNITIKFDFPMHNGEVNVEKLDNWLLQIEVYCTIQNIDDDVTKNPAFFSSLGRCNSHWDTLFLE